MDTFNMDLTKMEDAASELDAKVASQVLETFSAAPAAAQAAAGANMGYMTSAAMIATFAELAKAIAELTKRTKDHANLIRTTAETARAHDDGLENRTFNTSTIFPAGS